MNTTSPQANGGFSDSAPNAVIKALDQANPSGNTPVIAGTTKTADGSDTLPDGLRASHEYSVLGTYTDSSTGQTMVTLRDPWNGSSDLNSNDQGVLSLPLNQFMQDFHIISVGAGDSAFGGAQTGKPPPASSLDA